MPALPHSEDEDETDDTENCEELTQSVGEIVETIDKALGELEAIDQNELRNRYKKRLEKAESKLKVAKTTLEELVELTES